MKSLRDPKRRATHPGAILREDVLPALEMTQTEFAQRIGVSRLSVSERLHEKRSMTPEMAARVAKLLNTTPESWLRMQQAVIQTGRRYGPLTRWNILSYNVAHNSEDWIMASNAVVRARIDEYIKEEATIVLEAIGLTTSDAIRIMLTRVAREKALPFELLVPNKKTIKAMKEARRGNLPSFSTVKELMADLDADD